MKVLNNYLNKYSFFYFVIVTLIIMLLRTPFWDETHAFDISCLKLSEIFYLTRIEGHPILWYLILKPFNSIKLYPYPMLFINWFFCISAVYILWKKAPFTPLQKFMMTFSVPFLFYYAPVARCYSIGILLFFIICYIYKLRFKRPYFFSVLLCLCANTNILMTIGAFYTGLLFLKELYLRTEKKLSSKKKLYGVLTIFLLCSIFIILQFVGLRKCEKAIITMTMNISPFAIVLKMLVLAAMLYFPYVMYKISKKCLYLASAIYITLGFLFVYVYSANYWNCYIFYVYFIAIFWIFYKELSKNKQVIILFNLILFMCLFVPSFNKDWTFKMVYQSKSKQIAKYISEDKRYRNADLYVIQWWSDVSPGAGAYLKKNNIKILDIYQHDRRSFESLKQIFHYRYLIMDFDEFMSRIDRTKDNYVFISDDLKNMKMYNVIVYEDKGGLVFKTKKNTFFFELVDDKESLLGFKAYKIKVK